MAWIGEIFSSFFTDFSETIHRLVASFRWYDALDILVVALLVYYCIKLFRQTRAIHLLRGVFFIVIVYLIVNALNMSTMSFLFNRLFNNIVIVAILLFQPEFRHAIESFGRRRDLKRFALFFRDSSMQREVYQNAISSIVMACMNMSENRIGALIVLEDKTPLEEIIATGSEIDAKVSVPLLENIFYPKSPLHDGAMIIRDARVCAAGCILPLTENDISRELGTRHRAAVGMSEASDAMVLVVSEETGAVSIAKNGRLLRNLTSGQLLEHLNDFMLPKEEEKKAKTSRRKHHEQES